MKLFKKTMLLAFTLLAMFGFTLAAVASTGRRVERSMSKSNSITFSQADRNGDGYIEMQEAAKVPGIRFARADTDLDGLLNKQEWIAAGGKVASENKTSENKTSMNKKG